MANQKPKRANRWVEQARQVNAKLDTVDWLIGGGLLLVTIALLGVDWRLAVGVPGAVLTALGLWAAHK